MGVPLVRSVLAALTLVLALSSAGAVLADCYYNGKQVPEGSRSGTLVCKNGQWVEGG